MMHNYCYTSLIKYKIIKQNIEKNTTSGFLKEKLTSKPSISVLLLLIRVYIHLPLNNFRDHFELYFHCV